MNLQQIEAWASAVVDSLLAGQPVEDDRVELKRQWPVAAHKTARQIAGHANLCAGQDILWLIGVDEGAHNLMPLDDTEPADWWSGVSRYFADGVVPDLRILSVNLGRGQKVVALSMRTDRAPYLVKTESGGQVEREVPWREANSTRTARRHELLRTVVAQASVPELEVVEAQVTLAEEPTNGGLGQGKQMVLECDFELFVSAVTSAFLPAHRQTWVLGTPAGVQVPIDVTIRGSYRYTGASSRHGLSATEPAGGVEVLARRDLNIRSSGVMQVSFYGEVSPEQGQLLARSAQLTLDANLPVDRSAGSTTLRAVLSWVPGSDKRPQGPQTFSTQIVEFRATYLASS